MEKKYFNKNDKEYMRINGYRMLADKDNSGEGYVCPSCGSGTGPKGTGLRSKDGIHYKCFACGWGRKGNKQKGDGDIFDYVGVKYGISKPLEQLIYTSELMGVGGDVKPVKEKTLSNNLSLQAKHQEQQQEEKTLTPEEIEEKKKQSVKRYIKYRENLQNNKKALKYMTDRGFSKKVLSAYDIGYMQTRKFSKKGNLCNYIVVPVTDYHCIIRGASFEFNFKRHELIKGFHVALWRPLKHYDGLKYVNGVEIPKSLIEKNRQVIVCEGCMDTLTCLELGFNSISLNSANNREKFVEHAKEHPEYEYIIEMDNDKAGQDATQEIIEKLKDINVNYKVLDIVKTFKGGVFKDLNACLMDDRYMLKNHIDNLLGRTGENESKKEKTA